MANYLKPQSPLQHKDGDYFYPLTTIDQIITKDNTRLNAELVSVNLDDVIEGAPNKINADTLQGYTAEDFFNAKSSDVQLNYSVVGGLTEPSNPTENMIWVQTDQPITGHVFRTAQPINPSEGMIWIYTGPGSNVSFDRIILNNIGIQETYPIFVKQYISNEWINKIAKSYQNHTWVDWFTQLYYLGDQFESITGGWRLTLEGTKGSLNTSNNELLLTCGGAMNGVICITNKKIDLSNVNNIHFNISTSTTSGAGQILGVSPVNDNWASLDNTVARLTLNSTTIGEYILNVSDLSGEYYVGFYYYSGNQFGCNKIWMS